METYDTTKGRLFTWMLNVARNASIDAVRSKSYPTRTCKIGNLRKMYMMPVEVRKQIQIK